MVIVYESLTGNIKRFVGKLNNLLLNDKFIKLNRSMEINEPYVLITCTTGFGHIPKSVQIFLEKNHENLQAVVGSGDRNWGTRFCQASKDISLIYHVPLLHTFEKSGLQTDVEIVAHKINELKRKGE